MSVLDGLITQAEFAAQVNRHPRTVARWTAMGMSGVVRVGNQPLYDPPKAREWILNRCATAQHLRTRRRGRGKAA
jgi:hypothetical protein